jgi:hypothetical protein
MSHRYHTQMVKQRRKVMHQRALEEVMAKVLPQMMRELIQFVSTHRELALKMMISDYYKSRRWVADIISNAPSTH